ncbi:MAG TPA: hypothetical protein VH063_19270, partial [Gaiellaceae bacterium]|nr:hypothetical protein [Gaiellaceae bacterium]
GRRSERHHLQSLGSPIVIGTYAAALAVCVASLAIGQAVIVLCGRRRWSWASAPVGLAILGAVCWATVRLPGHGSISAILVLILVAASLGYLQGKGIWREGFTVGWPVAVLAAIAASLPFITGDLENLLQQAVLQALAAIRVA